MRSHRWPSFIITRPIAWLAVLLVAGSRLGAQGLQVKETLAGSGATGCAAFPPPRVSTTPESPNVTAEARRLIAAAQDDALLGEHAGARDAFAKALELTPGNARVAYYLGREHEALKAASEAVAAYCRYLALAPSAPDGDEVRGRIVRLMPSTELTKIDEAQSTFRSGVTLLQRGQYTAADSAFASVSQAMPSAPEPYYNRALARAAQGSRRPALDDFEKYLELAPSAIDRGAVRLAMSGIPDGVFSTRASFGSGLLFPGLGQMTTGRPVWGVLVLAAVSGAGVFAMQSSQSIQARNFTDPFQNPYVDSIPTTKHPNFVAAAAGAAAIWIGAAFEASSYARRSHRKAEAIINRDRTTEPRRVSLRIVPARSGVAIAIGVQ